MQWNCPQPLSESFGRIGSLGESEWGARIVLGFACECRGPSTGTADHSAAGLASHARLDRDQTTQAPVCIARVVLFPTFRCWIVWCFSHACVPMRRRYSDLLAGELSKFEPVMTPPAAREPPVRVCSPNTSRLLCSTRTSPEPYHLALAVCLFPWRML